MSAQVAGKRPLGVLGRAGVVAGMHAAVLFVIAQGFVLKEKAGDPPDLIAQIVDDHPPIIDEAPRTADPQLQEPLISMPDPQVPPIEDDTQPPPERVAAKVGSGERISDGHGSADPMISSVHQLANRPLTQPPYPPADVRAGNEGNVQIEVYVLADGRVGDARVLRSSGFPRLDQAALDEAKRKWRLQPATRNGVAFAQWSPLRVVFKLEDQ